MPKPKRGRVIVVGSSNTDLVVHCANLPRPGETVLGKDLLTFAGGKGANQAVAAARAGARVHFIGAFGNDEFGRARRADLEAEGIDCSGCVTKKGVPSGVALIGIGKGDAHAENLILVASGANARLSSLDVRHGMPKDLTREDVVLCSMEIPLSAVLAAVKYGRRWIGPRRVLNPAPYPQAGLPNVVYDFCTVVTPNETEFQAMMGVAITSFDFNRFQARRPIIDSTYLVTRGAGGVVLFNWDRKPSLFPAPKVKPVDTVGAGDCFNGCLAAHMAANQEDLDHSVRFAIAAAALKVTRQGAQAGMPRKHEIEKFLHKK